MGIPIVSRRSHQHLIFISRKNEMSSKAHSPNLFARVQGKTSSQATGRLWLKATHGIQERVTLSKRESETKRQLGSSRFGQAQMKSFPRHFGWITTKRRICGCISNKTSCRLAFSLSSARWHTHSRFASCRDWRRCITDDENLEMFKTLLRQEAFQEALEVTQKEEQVYLNILHTWGSSSKSPATRLSLKLALHLEPVGRTRTPPRTPSLHQNFDKSLHSLSPARVPGHCQSEMRPTTLTHLAFRV